MAYAVMPEQPAPGHSAALDLAHRGRRIFPLIPGSKRPAVTRWETRATTDPRRVARCWDHADYNIGVATGPSRLVVIDLDVPKPGDEAPDGATAFAALCERSDQPYPADTYTVATPSGGTHLYFTAPDNRAPLRNTAGRLASKVDTRAHGGYVVAPGSTINGAPYVVTNDAPPAPLPAWLVPLLTPPPLPPQRPITVPLTASDRRGRYLKTAVDAELKRVTDSAPREHNRDLFRASVALGQLVAGGALNEGDVTAWLTEAAAQVGQRPGETARTIRSGLRTGAHRPRQVTT